jgi:hypothetical protein
VIANPRRKKDIGLDDMTCRGGPCDQACADGMHRAR